MLPHTHPDAPEEAIPPFDAVSIPSDAADVIPANEVLPPPIAPAGVPGLPLPRVVLGCATFGYGVYDDLDNVRSSMPVRVVRAALRAGMNAFDTAPHYHPSEIILGHALAALRDEFPRESYSIVTKAAKYGAKVGQHYYDPGVVRRSVERSLARLQTSYLDVVYLHDVEFVASKPFPTPAGAHLSALGRDAAVYGLDDPTKSYGAGDDAIVACFAALREMQAEGKIRRVGLAGYPLPVLLRLSHLILAKTGQPVDIVQTYAHQTLLCSTLEDGYLAAFEKARVPQVVNAAPLSMGILTRAGGPDWHPAKKVQELYDATRQAVAVAEQAGSTIEEAACAFGYRTLQYNSAPVPVVIGCTNLDQIHQTLRAYADINAARPRANPKRDAAIGDILALFDCRGVRNISWQSPAPDAFE